MPNETAQVVIVAYKPKPGKDAELLQLTREHLPTLRREGLATDMPETTLMAESGVIVESFEWAAGGMELAHSNPTVLAMWRRYFEACDVVPLRDLAEASQLFASFRRIKL